MNASIKPSLIEPGMKSFMDATLKKCASNKQMYQVYMMNISGYIIFILVLALFAFMNYKGKLTEEELRARQEKERDYILAKLRNIEDSSRDQGLITKLPTWTSDLTIMNDKYYR